MPPKELPPSPPVPGKPKPPLPPPVPVSPGAPSIPLPVTPGKTAPDRDDGYNSEDDDPAPDYHHGT